MPFQYEYTTGREYMPSKKVIIQRLENYDMKQFSIYNDAYEVWVGAAKDKTIVIGTSFLNVVEKFAKLSPSFLNFLLRKHYYHLSKYRIGI